MKSKEHRDRSQEAMASTFAEGMHLLSVASRDILQKEAKNRHTGGLENKGDEKRSSLALRKKIPKKLCQGS